MFESFTLYLFTLLTLGVFIGARLINTWFKLGSFYTFLISLGLLIPIILVFNIPFKTYLAGNFPLNALLAPAIVALAVPLYEQLPKIQLHWKVLLTISFVASLFSMLSGAILAIALGASPSIVATLLPKSITTAIAISIADELGGIPSIAACCVIIAGIQGGLMGYVLLKKIRVRRPNSIGLAIGAASHVIGTASCIEKEVDAGTYSSIALVLCGIISAILAPIMFTLIYWFY